MGYDSKENILKHIEAIDAALFKAYESENYSIGDGQANQSVSRSIESLSKQREYWLSKLEDIDPSRASVYRVQFNLGGR